MTTFWSDVVGLSSDVVGLSSNRLSIGGSIQGVTAVAGALFGEVAGWLYLLHALEMTFHIWRRLGMTFILRGRRSIWWCWRVTLLAPRIGNDVSYVTQIRDDIHFAWQAQYLVILEGDFTCSTHWKWRFICDAEQWWHSFCVAGAIFGEVRVGLFVAGAALRDILGDSRDAKCYILQYKIVSKMGRVRSRKRRVRDDDFLVGCGRIVVGCGRIIIESSFYWRQHSGSYRRGRHTIWWGYRVTLLAPRIGNDVSICHTNQWWHSFCVAGAVFGEVGRWFLFRSAL